MRDRDKFRGCLFGGAIGDALGYSVEFMELDQIRQKYGENGITSYDLKNGVAEISDDTQMTLFTANGLLIWKTRGMMRGIAAVPNGYCWHCYKAWLTTQNGNCSLWRSKVDDILKKSPWEEYPWLIQIPELHNRRAPGNTVLSVLRTNKHGAIDQPTNDSKGCGSIMRVAPIGLYFENTDIDTICLNGAENAALTHGHDLGYIPAAALVYIINRIIYDDYGIPLGNIVNDCIRKIELLFNDKPHINDFIEIMEKSVKMAKSDINDVKAIAELGEGWVAEETLAIAVYCSLRYHDNFEKAIIASVNHSGDSDSTGSVTGNIMGAIHGYNKIPEKFISSLELKDIIMEIADDLYSDCQICEYQREPFTEEDEKWYSKYCC
jgi:ADP-ribosylglycohydrolase